MKMFTRRQLSGACAAAAVLGTHFGATALADDKSARPGPPSPEEYPSTDRLAIDEGRFVPINGIEQWITMRGRSSRNPVLLWLHGGPGFSMSSRARLFAPWEYHYTVVQWDQPRSGFTLARNLNRDIGPLTLERFAADARAVTQYVRHALGVKRILLIGQSWGTQIGLTLAHESPELYWAYCGTGQAISGSRGDKLGYELALKAAHDRRDAPAIEALEKVGPPPYATFEAFTIRQRYTNPPGLPPSAAEKAHNQVLQKLLSTPPPTNATYIPHDVPSYDAVSAFIETQKLMWQEVRKFEAESLGYHFRIPIYFVEGANDINTPVQLVHEYFGHVQSPRKGFLEIAGAGHNTLSFREEFLALLRYDVRPSMASVSESIVSDAVQQFDTRRDRMG